MMKTVLMFFVVFTLQLNADHHKITLQLQWLHQFQFAGFYVAKEKGFYRDAGLDVTIKEMAKGMDVVDEVISTRTAYGVGRSSLLLERSSGKPVVVLAALFQNSPSVLITTNPEIRTVEDLKGKRVMITGDEAGSAAITSMLLSHGVRKKDLQLQRHTFDYRDLVSGKTDAMACYLSNEPFLLDELNVSYTIFDPKDHHFDFYGDLLFTSQYEIDTNPDRVAKFFKASMKGWMWAFEHIEETAALIREKYNTQNKSLQSLIYEGQVLRSLALENVHRFGYIDKQRFQHIANIYKISGLMEHEVNLDEFINPLGIDKERVKVGILSKRGDRKTHERWGGLIRYLNSNLFKYHFELVPLDFEELEEAVAAKAIDFVITNTMYYVQLEHDHHISRIATVLNLRPDGKGGLSKFGGVVLTRADNHKIKSIKDIKNRSFGAVSERSFGGWMMALELMHQAGIERGDVDLRFLNTHDAVVRSVFNGSIDAGTVRTDTLERMSDEGLIDLSEVKVIEPKQYEGFPYMISTPLYPEWPLAKLEQTSEKIALDVVSVILNMDPMSAASRTAEIAGWTVPLDYSDVHRVLKDLRVPPYDHTDVTLMEVLKKYALWLYVAAAVVLFLVGRLVYVRHANVLLESYSKQLNKKVQERTHELESANEELKRLARIDPLLQIYNRGYFMEMAEHYFEMAKRNKTPLQVMMLDIDHFKVINDTYGHAMGDEILKLFAATISKLLRRTDLFGRVGGEEFSICLQNTSFEGAHEFAQRLRRAIEECSHTLNNGRTITCTVSIGIATLNDDEMTFSELLKKADKALYKAKESGRNRVVVYDSTMDNE